MRVGRNADGGCGGSRMNKTHPEFGHEMDEYFAYCVRCGCARKAAASGVLCVAPNGKIVAISHIVRGARLFGIAPIPSWADQRGER